MGRKRAKESDAIFLLELDQEGPNACEIGEIGVEKKTTFVVVEMGHEFISDYFVGLPSLLILFQYSKHFHIV